MQKLICLLLLFSSVLIKTYSQEENEWVLIGTASKNNIFYMKSDCVSRGRYAARKDVVRIWTKFILPQEKIDGITYRNATRMTLFAADLNGNEIAVETHVYYSSDKGKIKTVNVGEYELKWQPPVPESVGETLFSLLYRGYKLGEKK